jgi:hypothetical protein
MEADMTDKSNPTKAEVIDLEKSYWDAMKKKDGHHTAKLSADPSLVTGARGVLRIAKAKMGAMTEEGNWSLEKYAFEEVEVTVPRPDIAIIAYKVRQTCTMDGEQFEIHAADQSTWLRGPDGWECHAHSETVLDDKAA